MKRHDYEFPIEEMAKVLKISLVLRLRSNEKNYLQRKVRDLKDRT